MDQNKIIPLKDPISEKRLLLLHPMAQPLFRAFIHECETMLDITLRITQGLRTFAEQDAIYQQGRTVPGKVVSNAKAGSSYHNFGLAIDLVVLPVTGGVDWNYDMSKLLPFAEKHGIEWGGSWHTIQDKPHFQITFGYLCQALLNLRNTGKVENGYVIV